jgi:N-acetylneuraminic acid mutarotase
MKKTILLLPMVLIIIFTYSQTSNTWIQKADFGGSERAYAVGFSINGKGYIGTGQAPNAAKDFWEYDPDNDTWTQKADFGGVPRNSAVGLSIGNKGYIGTGLTQHGVTLKDFWEYNPDNNTWKRKADFGGGARLGAIGFGIGSKGYIGSGSGAFKDFWEYDPVADKWTQKADFGGGPREYASAFSINGMGYAGIGDSARVRLSDFWEYNPTTDTWTQKASYGGGGRTSAASFSMNGRGYIGTGEDSSGSWVNDFWEYDPATNSWTRKSDFGGIARSKAVGFAIGSQGYIGTGDISGDFITYVKDFWQYTPGEGTGCQPPSALKVPFTSDTSAVLKWTIPTNPVNSFDVLYRMIGSTLVHKRHTTGSANHVAINNLLPGTNYEWRIRSDCSADTTNWVNGPDFTTLSSTASILNANAKNLNLSGNAVQILPNPNNGNFVVQMQLPSTKALTTLMLYNNVGTKVWQQNAGVLSGSVSKSISRENKLSPGVYMLIIENGDMQLMQKVVVSK